MNKFLIAIFFLLILSISGGFYHLQRRHHHHMLNATKRIMNIEAVQLVKVELEEIKKEDPKNLLLFGQKYFSQNDEDGIIQEIFNRILPTNKFFVEFGVAAFENNTLNLLLQGWEGFWIEGDKEIVEFTHKAFSKEIAKKLKTQQAFITKENIVQLFESNDVPKSLDLLSVDIDGNDYWICQELLQNGYAPRVVIVEYNALFSPHVDFVSPYKSDYIWDESSNFGSSLKSIQTLLHSFDYELVACNFNGINAFFVRKELLNDQFSHVGSLKKLYRPIGFHYISFPTLHKHKGLGRNN